jgi:uncharacterized protein (TIGR00251 family)
LSNASSSPYTVVPDGVRLAVRLTPRARLNAIAGLTTGPDGRAALAIRLAAPPVDGAANKALIAFLAERLGLPKSAISISSGDTARLKMLHVAGDSAAIADRIDGIACTASEKGS